MMSRQHSGYQAFHKTGKTRSATAIPQRRREGTGMAVWFMRGLLPALRRIHLFRVEIAADAGSVETPTNDRRDNVLRTRELAHALNHGGADSLKRNPSRRQTGKGITKGGIHDDSNAT